MTLLQRRDSLFDDQTVVSHLAPDDYVGSLRNASGGATISLGFASALTGKASGTVQYHDYGQFLLKAGAVRDADFAGGDKTNGDCVSGSYSNILNNGKYGCDVANIDFWLFPCPPELLKDWHDIDQLVHLVEKIDIRERKTTVVIERDEAIIQKIKDKIPHCQNYYEQLFAERSKGKVAA